MKKPQVFGVLACVVLRLSRRKPKRLNIKNKMCRCRVLDLKERLCEVAKEANRGLAL